MILFLEKLASNIERSIKNTEVAFRIYGVLFAFCFIFFGVYGIIPLSRAIKTKVATIREMETAFVTMEKNLEMSQKAEKDLNENKELVALLDRYMPQETNVQNYMLDFIQSIGINGYSVKNFTQDVSNSSKGQIELSLLLEGLVYPTNIVKQVETLKRVTQVKRVNVYQNSKGILNVNLVLTIYTLVI